MKIRELLQREFSLENTLKTRDFIGEDPLLFHELMDIYLKGDKTMAPRAAWVLSHVHDQYPHLTDLYVPEIIELLSKPAGHDAIKRNGLRILMEKRIPEEYLGICADFCFNFLNGREEPVAVKVNAMSILKGIVLRVPELKDELVFSIEEQYPFQTAGFKNRAQKVLKAINNL